MPLAPPIKEFLEQLERNGATPLNHMTTEQARRQMQASTALLGEKEAIHHVADRQIAGPAGEIALRVYRPREGKDLAGVLYFHGGGWVLGDLESHDGYCRALANACEASVISVDYRLAPEHPFPAALEDCFAATRWVSDNAAELGVDAQRIAVAGDSAGGNLAAAVSLAARDRGGPTIGFQALVYPIADCDFDNPSYRENADDYFLTREAMIWFWDLYTPDGRGRDNCLARLAAAEDLRHLPPALVVTAEYDPLRDEGELWAARLIEAGVPVARRRYEGTIHGFARRLNAWPEARQCLAEVAAAIKNGLGR